MRGRGRRLSSQAGSNQIDENASPSAEPTPLCVMCAHTAAGKHHGIMESLWVHSTSTCRLVVLLLEGKWRLKWRGFGCNGEFWWSHLEVILSCKVWGSIDICAPFENIRMFTAALQTVCHIPLRYTCMQPLHGRILYPVVKSIPVGVVVTRVYCWLYYVSQRRRLPGY